VPTPAPLARRVHARDDPVPPEPLRARSAPRGRRHARTRFV